MALATLAAFVAIDKTYFGVQAHDWVLMHPCDLDDTNPDSALYAKGQIQLQPSDVRRGLGDTSRPCFIRGEVYRSGHLRGDLGRRLASIELDRGR